MIKPGIGNEIRNEMGNEMTILYQINVSKYLEGKKERRNTKGERARVYYRGIKKWERRPRLSNDKKSKKLYWLYSEIRVRPLMHSSAH